jgi:cell division protein FtsB
MFTALQHRKIKHILHSRWVAVLAVVLAALLSLAAVRAYMNMLRAEARYAEVVAEHEQLQEREADLAQKVAELEDPRGIEAALRDRYSVAKEGEVVLVLEQSDEQQVASDDAEKKGVWGRVLDFFGL